MYVSSRAARRRRLRANSTVVKACHSWEPRSLSSESDLAPGGLKDNPIYSETPSPNKGLGSTPRNCCLFVCKERYTRSLVLINIHVCVNRMTRILYCPRVEGLPTPTPPHNPNRLKAISKLTAQLLLYRPCLPRPNGDRRREGLITLPDPFT
jgi:hypothetical protein